MSLEQKLTEIKPIPEKDRGRGAPDATPGESSELPKIEPYEWAGKDPRGHGPLD